MIPGRGRSGLVEFAGDSSKNMINIFTYIVRLFFDRKTSSSGFLHFGQSFSS